MAVLLKISDIGVGYGSTSVISHFSMTLHAGMVVALMGPNGSGKSTLARTLIGDQRCVVQSGILELDGHDITTALPDERARRGLFLAFQQPCTIPGLTLFALLREAYAMRVGRIVGVDEFKTILFDAMAVVGIEQAWAFRSLNEGFSGGEKKRLELVQLIVLQPRLAILDELDSGLDVDSLLVVARGIAYAREKNPEMTLLVITHYPRILQYVLPDEVHIFYKGSIVHSGGADLAECIGREGYDAFIR
jgi:Fe-S cluster assembly ATP-binding protein